MDTELRVCEKPLLTDDYCLFLTERGGNHQRYHVVVIFKSEHDIIATFSEFLTHQILCFLVNGEQLPPSSALTSLIIL